MKQPENTYLAQINVATAVDDLDSSRLAEFVAALDRVNAVAERSPGFVWRLMDEEGNATGIHVSDDPRMIVNLSVWKTPEAANFAMWWVPVGHEPTADEAMDRLVDLRANGPSERAFGWEALPSVTLWKEQRCA